MGQTHLHGINTKKDVVIAMCLKNFSSTPRGKHKDIGIWQSLTMLIINLVVFVVPVIIHHIIQSTTFGINLYFGFTVLLLFSVGSIVAAAGLVFSISSLRYHSKHRILATILTVLHSCHLLLTILFYYCL